MKEEVAPSKAHKVFTCRQGGRHDDWKREKGGEREKERQREREREREREGKRDKERKRKAERDRKKQTKTERERGKKERERKKDKERERERKTKTEGERQTDKEGGGHRERERARDGDGQPTPPPPKKKAGPISVARGLRPVPPPNTLAAILGEVHKTGVGGCVPRFLPLPVPGGGQWWVWGHGKKPSYRTNCMVLWEGGWHDRRGLFILQSFLIWGGWGVVAGLLIRKQHFLSQGLPQPQSLTLASTI